MAMSDMSDSTVLRFCICSQIHAHCRWGKGALLAINFVVNIEEGSEPSIPDGDAATSAGLIECPSDAPAGVRDLGSEGMFEYGSRCGV